MYKKSNATVLIFTLLILSVILVLTQQLMKSVMVGSVFDKTMVHKEQSELLALSGINLAIAQLTLRQSVHPEQSRREGDRNIGEPGTQPIPGKGDQDDKNFKEWLLKILSNLNRWQIFDLKEDIDGMDGKLKICISCENGKININNAFDFEKQEFKKDYDVLLKGLEIKGKLPAGQIYNKLSEYLKKRERKLDDITEILDASDLDIINLFYNPPTIIVASKESLSGKKAHPNIEICLQDLFTIWTPTEKIEPLFLSDSMCAVLGIRRPMANDAEKLKDAFKKVVDSFKKDWGKSWDANWNFLLPIYDKKPKTLNAINKLLSQGFGAQVYSVLSCGIVGDVECKLLAILKKETKKQNQPSKQEEHPKLLRPFDELRAQDERHSEKEFKVVRIYWL